MHPVHDLFNDPRPRPRDYQFAAVDALHDVLKTDGIAAAESATGTGKTLMQAMLSERYKRTLFAVPRISLTYQLAAGVEAWRLQDCAVEQAANWAPPDSPLVAASLDTLTSDARYKRFRPDLVVVDEMHYGLGEATIEMLDYYRALGAHVCGFTATPHARPDGTSPLDYYGRCPVQYGVLPAIAHGRLVPLRARRVMVKTLDFSGMGRLGDFAAAEAEAILRREAVMQEQAALVVENHDRSRSGAVYCSSIATATAVRTLIESRHGVPCALVHSKMRPEERADELRRFEKGEASLVANVSVLTMGWDSSRCSELHLLKPTLSLPRYIQIVGRSLRPLPGCADQPTEYLRRLAISQSAKPHALIVDYTDTTMYHKVCSAVDVMLPPKNRRYRERLIDRAGEEDITAEKLAEQCVEIDDEIKREEKAERERVLAEIQQEKQRRRCLVVGVTFDAHSVDPFAKPTKESPSRREPRMLWGPYRGQPIRTIPPRELARILRTMKRSPGTEWLRKAIKREIDRLAKVT